FLLLRVAFRLQRTSQPKSEDAPNNLYEPIPAHDRVRGDFGNLAIPSVSDWLDKNPALKWGAIASVAAVALLVRQALKNGGQI
ncbi:MAG TPA: hypothetical protein V6D03_09325, partial [Candidatus Caenarcaniphilales bacterium]